MRPELNEIEYIEKYLLGKLDKAEKLEFDKALLSDVDFKEKVELQKSLIEGVKNIAIKKAISKAYKKFKFNTKLKWGVGFGVILLVVGSVAFLNLQKNQDTDSIEEDFKKETGIDLPISEITGGSLKLQEFIIDGSRDTVINTEDGIVYAIEAGSFLDENGKEVSGEIKFVSREAIEVDDILSSGMSTVTTDGKQLETGGMFYINATSEGKKLSVNPNKGILTQVPTANKKPEMKLYSGEYQTDGRLLWKSPEELEHFLIPVDMSLLNFYPENFEKELYRLGFANADKHVKDSVYYSFVSHFSAESRDVFTAENAGKYDLQDYYKYPIKTGLNPANVKAIWGKKFNGSLLATKEFESRMKVIHRTGINEILDLYVSNANYPLWKIDEKVANMAIGSVMKTKFRDFAKLQEGRVKTNSRLLKKLNDYYNDRSLKYKRSLAKVTDYWKKQSRLDKKAGEKERKYNEKEGVRLSDNLNKEFRDNLDTVYAQLGFRKAKATYNVTITRIGWNNIDRQVMAATVARESATITYNGKTAELKYSKFELAVPEEFDRVYAYVLTKKLPSFQRMLQVSKFGDEGELTDAVVEDLRSKDVNEFKFSLNDYYKYGVAIIGYRGEEVFTFFEDEITFDDETTFGKERLLSKKISLEKSKSSTFYKKIGRFTKSSVKSDIKKDLAYLEFQIEDNSRKIKQNEMINFRREMQEYIFPLYYVADGDYLKTPRSKINIERSNNNNNNNGLEGVLLEKGYSLVRIEDSKELYELDSLATKSYFGPMGSSLVYMFGRNKLFNKVFIDNDYGSDLKVENYRKEGGSIYLNNMEIIKDKGYWVAKLEEGSIYFIEQDIEVVQDYIITSEMFETTAK
jgi:hypothetical protein